ncbi:hypothetical protein ES707_08636 [subsurface metagenome]
MGLAGGFQILGELSYAVNGRISTDRIGLQVKIHGLGGMDASNAVFGKIYYYAACIVTAGNNQTADIEFLKSRFDALIFFGIINFRDLDP